MSAHVNQQNALAAWGSNAPDWVISLAKACDKSGLRKVAAKIGVSGATVCLALHKKQGSVKKSVRTFNFIKQKVEQSLMITMIPCPMKGLIAKTECVEEQNRPFLATNPMRAKQFKACQQCKFKE